MHCQRCQKAIRSCDGLKCEDCESHFHAKCVSSGKDMEAGDRGYQWQCAVCQTPADSGSRAQLVADLQRISEKVELVNKIQLPKLTNDLHLLKSTADRISKQNEEILDKISQLQKVEQKGTVAVSQSPKELSKLRRRRPLSLNRTFEDKEDDKVPMISSEKCARYRTRRRSYHLYKVFLLVNRKLRRSRTPRNKSPR